MWILASYVYSPWSSWNPSHVSSVRAERFIGADDLNGPCTLASPSPLLVALLFFCVNCFFRLKQKQLHCLVPIFWAALSVPLGRSRSIWPRTSPPALQLGWADLQLYRTSGKDFHLLSKPVCLHDSLICIQHYLFIKFLFAMAFLTFFLLPHAWYWT